MKRKHAPVKVLNVKELMEQMGFSKHAPASTQEAFIKHLGRVLGQNVVNIRPSEEDERGQSQNEDQEADDQLDLFKKAS